MNPQEMLRQAQLMQNKMAKIQEDLVGRVEEATAGGGMVTVQINGAQEILSVTIDKAVVDPEDVDMLQDLVLAAVNEAIKKSKDMAEKEMGAVTRGFKIPGMF